MSPAGEYIWMMHDKYRAQFECYGAFVFVNGDKDKLPTVEDAQALSQHGLGIVEILSVPAGGLPEVNRRLQ